MNIEILHEENGVMRCKFPKRMDTYACRETQNKILQRLPFYSKVVFDLDGTEYLASQFLSICFKTHSATQGNLVIVNMSRNLKIILKNLGLINKLCVE